MNDIQEAKLIGAEGAGFTGGDPLCKLERTIFYLKKLKKVFGKKFHVHLYTSLDLINKNNLEKLHNAGLDEIRFHLDLDNNKLWDKVQLALNYDWDVGIEIPIIPGKEENIKKINSEIKIYPSFKVFSKRDLSEFNKSLGRDDSILANHSNDKILLKVSTHQSTFSSLLSDLVEHFISEQKIRECVDCGKFFVLENPKRLFCDDSCRDRYKKRKKYKVKKES